MRAGEIRMPERVIAAVSHKNPPYLYTSLIFMSLEQQSLNQIN